MEYIANNMKLFMKRIEDFHLEMPYDLVNEGAWTLDKMAEMANIVAADLNGNGEVDIEGDPLPIPGRHLFFRKVQHFLPARDMIHHLRKGSISHSGTVTTSQEQEGYKEWPQEGGPFSLGGTINVLIFREG